MEDLKKGDFIITRQGHIDEIEHLDKPNITLNGEEFNTDDVSPIPIDAAKGIVLYSPVCMGSLIDNGITRVEKPVINTHSTNKLKDKMGLSFNSKNDMDGNGSYWHISDISQIFLKENNIQYVHELQHYLEGTSLRIRKQ